MSGTVPSQAILVVNTMSRHGQKAFDEACDLLATAGIELIERHAVDNPDKLRPTIRAAVSKAPMVIVGGGDGTISSFAGEFQDSDCLLAILPLGTANSFARTLGFPLELEDAVKAIAGGRPGRMDLGCIGDETFANLAALGMSPLIAETIPDGLKKWLGIFGYIVWAAYMAFRFRPFRLTVIESGEKHRHWATEVRIANGRFHGGVELVEDADIGDGRITVQAVTGTHLSRLAWSWFTTLFKLRTRDQTWREWEARELRIETRPSRSISIDGEVRARTPVTVRAIPNAIRIVLPAIPAD